MKTINNTKNAQKQGEKIMITKQEIEKLKKIQDAIKKFNFSARVEKEIIVIINKKGESTGHVKADGTIIRKKLGSRQLMGALVRDAIKDVL